MNLRMGEKYYSLTATIKGFEIHEYTWVGDEFDRAMDRQGIAFKKKSEAEIVLHMILHEIREYNKKRVFYDELQEEKRPEPQAYPIRNNELPRHNVC